MAHAENINLNDVNLNDVNLSEANLNDFDLNASKANNMSRELKLSDYPTHIEKDVKNLIEKYHGLVGTSAPEMDEDLADAFIMLEVRKVLKNIQDDKLEKMIN